MQTVIDDLPLEPGRVHFFADYLPVEPGAGDVAHEDRPHQPGALRIEDQFAEGGCGGFPVDLQVSKKDTGGSGFGRPAMSSVKPKPLLPESKTLVLSS